MSREEGTTKMEEVCRAWWNMVKDFCFSRVRSPIWMPLRIQKGDIVVRVGTQEIKNAADYMNVLRNAQTDGSINIVVQRASVNAYEEMHFVLQPEQQEQS